MKIWKLRQLIGTDGEWPVFGEQHILERGPDLGKFAGGGGMRRGEPKSRRRGHKSDLLSLRTDVPTADIGLISHRRVHQPRSERGRRVFNGNVGLP